MLMVSQSARIRLCIGIVFCNEQHPTERIEGVTSRFQMLF